MKFFAALLVHAALVLAVGGGILLLAIKGQWWLLALAVGAYTVGLYKYGCTSH